jgi:predicted ATPase/class 3 adenylate cyclase
MAAWLCASCEGENPEGTRFCGHCGAAAAASDSPIAQTLRSFVAEPVAERLVEAGGDFPEERRLITALFADVSGFTALADRLDPEELLEVIDPVIRGLSNIVGRFDGYVEKFAGDALLTLFGAPVSHEDDAARALLVALEMHRELARLCKNLPHQAELTLHCGVSSGHGIARVLGSEARMDYAVLGDSVILAQRLEAAAPKGETYVGDSTYRLTADRFEFEPVGELTLKGKSEAALAWRLVGEKRAEEAARTRPLVGRARELDAVASVFHRALEGRGGVVVVTGEPGVGKSRLTEGARQHARRMGFRWLQTRCLSYGASLAYWPYAELVRRMAGIQPDTASEEAVALLRAAVGLGGSIPFFVRLLGLPAAGKGDVEALEPEAFRRGLHDAFATLLSSLAAESQLVVVIEDVHWADASTLELTRELTGLCEERPLVLYVTARPESQSALEELPSQLEVQLDPLDETGIAELVANMLDGAAPAGLVPWVVERTTGNPFFVEELVRSLLDRGILQRSNGNWLLQAGWEEGDLPPTVEGLLASRIDLLPRPSVEVLQAAAVIGRVVPIALLDGVLGREATRELAILVDRALLDHVTDERGPTVAFHHALVLDVAYARLLRRQQRSLHRRVAEVAEALHGSGDDVVDLLARHLYLGEAGTKAIEYLARAGERAARLYANQEAIVHLSRAMELAEREPVPAERRIEIVLALADLYDLVGDYDSAIRLYAEARDASADLRAWRGLAASHRKQGEYERALAVVDEGFATLKVGDGDLTALWLERGWSLSVAGRFQPAIVALQAGLDAAGGKRDAVAAQLLLQLARAETVEGHFDAALEHGRAAQAIYEEQQDIRGMATAFRIVGDAYTQAGQLDEAVETLRQGLEVAERVGSAEEIGGCLVNLGLAEWERGHRAEAIGYHYRAIEEFERIGHGSGRARGYANLADMFAHVGEFEEALSWCRKALELSRSIGHSLTIADVYDTMAVIGLRTSDFSAAAAHAEEAAALYLQLGAVPQASRSLELAAEALSRCGDDERARDARARARRLGPSGLAS